MDTATTIKLTLSGKIDAITIGFQHVLLKSTGEHFSIKRPSTRVSNLLFGTMYLEHIGKMIIENHTNGNVCDLDFLP